MVEGIGTGIVIALAWAALLLPPMSPWAQDRFSDSVLSTVVSLVGTAGAFIAFDRGGDIAEAHGRLVGYGSVLGATAVVLVVSGVVLRRTPFFQDWQLYGVAVGRAPASKSRRTPKSRRAPRSQRV